MLLDDFAENRSKRNLKGDFVVRKKNKKIKTLTIQSRHGISTDELVVSTRFHQGSGNEYGTTILGSCGVPTLQGGVGGVRKTAFSPLDTPLHAGFAPSALQNAKLFYEKVL